MSALTLLHSRCQIMLNLRDVVEIDVNGETNQLKVEQIYRGAALKNDSVAKEWMFVELSEEFTMTKDLFEVVWREAALSSPPVKESGSTFG